MLSATFFSQLGKEKETQLSRTFATCFNTSPVFRHQILRLLHDTCRLPAGRVSDDAWHCATETHTPTVGGGRLDLHISADRSRTYSKTPVFVIENKVNSKLTLKQLQKYRRHDVKYLIAVTKHPADVPERQMKREGVFALRWQDIHRHLSSSLPHTPVDRFLIKAFIAYLEDLKMAYPERLNGADLRDLRRVLNGCGERQAVQGSRPEECVCDGGPVPSVSCGTQTTAC